MAVRFVRNGTATSIKVVDHNDLLNRGIRPHSDIDSYMDEMDNARGLEVSIGAVLDKIRADILGEAAARGDADTALVTAIDSVTDDVAGLEINVSALQAEVTDINSALAAKYEKPVDGIPETDLSQGLQDKLNSPQAGQEVIDARTDKDGQVYPSLKARLDDMQGKAGTGGSGNGGVGLELYQKFIITEPTTVLTIDKPYIPGTHQLEVHRNGIKQDVGTDYTETSENSITFLEPLEAGDLVVVQVLGKVIYSPKFYVESLPYTRSAPQRVFTIPKYRPGNHSLEVYVDGARLSVGTDYEEINSTTITFNFDVAVEAMVVFTDPGSGVGYALPADGIPQTDLTQDIQDILGQIQPLTERVTAVEESVEGAVAELDGRVDALENSLKQVTKLGITATRENPYVVDIPITDTVDFKRHAPEVIRFQEAEDLVRTECAFDNSDASSFEPDDQVIFDGKMHLDLTPKPMTDGGALGAGKLWTFSFQRSKTKKIEGVI